MAIKRTGDGKFQIQWYDSSGRFRKRTVKGIDREQAKRIERDILRERDMGGAVLDAKHAPTFAAAARQWMESNKVHWKASSCRQWQGVLDTHLSPAWGERRVSTLTEADATALQITLKDEKALGPRRSNTVLQMAKAVLAFSVRQQWVRVSPFAHVKRIKALRTEVDPLSREGLTRFLAGVPAWWRPYFIVSCWTGLRPSEQAAIAWDDIAATSLHVGAGLRRGVLSAPKTPGSVRDVDLLPPVVEALKTQKAQQAQMRLERGLPKPDRDLVFTDQAGLPVDVDNLTERVWKPTLKRAGLRYRPLYQCRHTFASNALAAGEAPAWVAAQLGHTNLTMIFTVYGRFIPNATRRDGSALLAHLGNGEHHPPQGRVAGEERGGA